MCRSRVKCHKTRDTPQGELAQKVRRVGELLAAGDATRAKEIVREALRDCESGHGNLPDCAYWLKALQGLDSLIDKPREKIVLTNSIGMRMVRIPASEYMMGSPKGEMDWLRLKFKKIWREGHKQWFQDELPLHPVRITHPFYMAATELTVGQFRQFVKETGYKTDAEKGDGGMIWSKSEARWVPKKDMKWDSVPWQIADNQPVVFVSWNDAQAFCKWLSNKEKRHIPSAHGSRMGNGLPRRQSMGEIPLGRPNARRSRFEFRRRRPQTSRVTHDGERWISVRRARGQFSSEWIRPL